MDDTAQQFAAETPLNEQLDQAAAAVKAMRTVSQHRDESGRFATDNPEADAPPLEDAETVEEYDDEETDEAEAPDEDQPEAVEMPKSWSKDDEALWQELPPAAQARIAEREGQRDAAINSKFQEIANVRKDYETKLTEANASRDKWAQDYDLLVADLSLPEPDPRAFGLGTQHYRRDEYDLAVLNWKQGNQQLNQLRQQREAIRAQQSQEQAESWNAQKEQIEAEYMPKLLSLVPELQSPEKGATVMRELIDWGVAQGLQPDIFSPENHAYITSAELRILALAKKAAEAEGGMKKVPPKKQPAIRPGVATPRSAQKTVAKQKAFDRLASENSIEAAVAAMRAARR
jgi:hypothetical protein